MFGWLKRFMPRGLYGRAALILLLPIITLQLVVSAAFLQRHFEDVTRQMTSTIANELRFVIDRIEAEGLAAGREIAEPLSIALAPGTAPEWAGQGDERRRFYDLSGRSVSETLRQLVPEVTWIDYVGTDRTVVLNLDLGTAGSVDASFSRRSVSASNPHQLLVLMIFTGIFMSAVAYVFLRNQLRPIRRLARAAEDFGKGRAVDYRPAGALEVRAAGRAFLDMRARIEQQIEQRTLMLSGVSHDLRTPLTRMRLALSMQDESEDVRALSRDVEEMEGLLETFLDFARSDALDDAEPADPLGIVLAVVADARRGGGEVEFRGPESAPDVVLRPLAVRRALQNLVSNALRYGSRARVTMHVLEKALRFTVEDDGPGIPPARRADALRPFVRLDAARNQDRGPGVGLGLSIAEDIARRHGGTIRLSESADLGGLRVDLVLAR